MSPELMVELRSVELTVPVDDVVVDGAGVTTVVLLLALGAVRVVVELDALPAGMPALSAVPAAAGACRPPPSELGPPDPPRSDDEVLPDDEPPDDCAKTGFIDANANAAIAAVNTFKCMAISSCQVEKAFSS